MKKIFVFLMIATMGIGVKAAELAYFPIRVEIADVGEPFPSAGAIQLTNKLNMLLTKQGIASMDSQEQFALTAFVVPQTKTVLPGPPTQYSEEMEMTFYVCDVVNKIVFASISQTVKAIGTTEGRCYMEAIKKIDPSNKEMQAFIERGIEKIVAYYDDQADRIFKEVEMKAHLHEYGAALAQITAFPTQSKRYSEAVALTQRVFDKYQDYICHGNLQQARTAWVQEQNARGAAIAGEFLAEIYPDAGCYKEAQELYKEIHDKVSADWKFEMKQYQDGIDLESQRIDAARQVGIEYGKHQTQQKVNFEFLRGL